jgi:ribosomal protein L4
VTVADGMVFGSTATSAFALNQSTGTQVWIKKLTRRAGEGIDMAPGFQADANGPPHARGGGTFAGRTTQDHLAVGSNGLYPGAQARAALATHPHGG